MNYLSLFENFSSSDYLWPDARFWMEDNLYPEEICFLTIYSDIVETESRWNKKEKPLFEIETDKETHSLDSGFYNEDEGKANFELEYLVPTKDGKFSIYVSVEAKGGFAPYTPATYYEPSEGGEPILNSIEIEAFSYINSEDTFEAVFTDGYQFKSTIIDKKKLISAMEYAASSRVEYHENESNIIRPTIPDELLKKCEDIRKTIPDVVKGTKMFNRFTQKD